MKYAAASNALSASEYKLTKARASILRVLVKMKGPFTAHELLARFKRSAKVDLATVYRNLPVFEKIGLICKNDFSDEVSRYLVTGREHAHHHHHIICRVCEKIEPVDFCALRAQEKMLSRLGYSEIKHRLEFSGLCKACA